MAANPVNRPKELIASLGLEPHPEGGWFRQIYRARATVTPDDGRPERAALTTIYFLLLDGEVSRWHRIASDEVWHFYEGAPLELYTGDPAFTDVIRTVLGESTAARTPVHVVPPGVWQAARTVGAYSLVGCTVGPGFEFADFQLIGDGTAESRALRHRHPHLAVFI